MEKSFNFHPTHINLCFALALQLIGVGGEHNGATLTAFLDLPDSHKQRRNMNVLENYMHETAEEVKKTSQDMALSEEVSETINLPEGTVMQPVTYVTNTLEYVLQYQ